jgi:hypothetical protein
LVDLMHLDPKFHAQLTGTVSEVIDNGTLRLPAALTADVTIQNYVNNIILPTSQLPDVLVWRHTSDGKLNSKQAFEFLRPSATDLSWAENIWSTAIPPSHSCIYWRLHHNKMPTDENLRRRGCIVVSVCSLCMSTDESSEHLFLRCNFANQLWDWIGMKLNCIIDRSTAGSLLSCRPARCSSQVSDIYIAAVLHTIHSIWWARNSLRFSDVVPTLHAAKVRIYSFIAMSGNVSKGFCIPSDSVLLDSFTVSPHCRMFRDIVPVLWKSPTAPWLKVNTDGSVIGGNAAYGGLFRDHRGTFRGAFAGNIGVQSVFYAEVLAIIIAIECAARNG